MPVMPLSLNCVFHVCATHVPLNVLSTRQFLKDGGKNVGYASVDIPT